VRVFSILENLILWQAGCVFKSMMRYYMHDGPAAFRFELAGALDSNDAARLEQEWHTASSVMRGRTLIIDLSFVTAIDEAVRGLFQRWYEAGAQFAAGSELSRELVERITGRPFLRNLPLAPTYHPWTSLRTILIAILVILASPMARAAAVDDGASLAFARFVSRATARPDGRDVTVEIDASLPKMGKAGRLQAIRHLGPTGTPQYQRIQSQGDSTVKQEVIARYLAIEQQTSARPASWLAVNTDNYKFRYAASIAGPGYRFYVFTIRPRHRREGLMDGKIWIDGDTGEVVHQQGRLARHGSIFVRAIDMVRDTGPRVDSPYVRVTRIDVETRLFGPAALTIRERPALPMVNGEGWR
jgi:hypothetical protein